MPAKPNRQTESLKRAVELALVDWDNAVIFSSRYDPTTDSTTCGIHSKGNTYALEGQVFEWADMMRSDEGCCPECCDCCGARPEDDDADDDDDSIDGIGDEDDADDVGNR